MLNTGLVASQNKTLSLWFSSPNRVPPITLEDGAVREDEPCGPVGERLYLCMCHVSEREREKEDEVFAFRLKSQVP